MASVYYWQAGWISSGLNDSKSFQCVLKSIQYGVKRAAEECKVSVDQINQWRSELGLNKQGEKRWSSTT